MNRSEKFKSFLESLKDGQHDSLIENIWAGFSVINESEMKNNGADGSCWEQPEEGTETECTDDEDISHWEQPHQGKVSKVVEETNADSKWEQP